MAWLTEAGPIVAYRRGDVIIAANCGDEPGDLDLPEGAWAVTVASDLHRQGGSERTALELKPAEAVILTSG